ncbi:MAG: polyprenol monophosphomannose synthase [Methylotenera sp.]|nr:polyprenol monophosphomannose synthase [Oligoflexia bacterium]
MTLRSLVVVPTYNEIENLQSLVDAVLASAPSTVDVLIVDDNSPDGTGPLADLLAAKSSRVHVLHRAKKMGLGTAYVNGFKWALSQTGEASKGHPGSTVGPFDTVIEMDADFSHNPKYLPQMLSLLNTSDVVIGSRYVTGGGTVNWGIGRKILSRGGSLYSRMILGATIRDFTGGFNGWKRNVLQAVDFESLRSDGYSFQIELKYRAFLKGFTITEFPIIFEDRKVGKSKMNKKIVVEALGRVWGFRMNSKSFQANKVSSRV